MCLVWLLVFFFREFIGFRQPNPRQGNVHGCLTGFAPYASVLPLWLAETTKWDANSVFDFFLCIKYCQLGLKYVAHVLWFYDVILLRSLVKCGCELASAPGALPVADGTSFAGWMIIESLSDNCRLSSVWWLDFESNKNLQSACREGNAAWDGCGGVCKIFIRV